MNSNIYIHNPVLSKFGRLEETVLSLAYKTASEALQGFDRDRIDFLVFASFAPESYTSEFHLAAKLASSLRLDHIFAIRAETASSSGASAFQLAVSLIDSGRFKTGLVVGAEIMSRLGREESNMVLGSVLSDRQKQLCMFMSHGGAMITRRYLYEYGYEEGDLYYIAKKVHDNGLKNKNAHIQKEINLEIYNKAPKICTPLGLYDISPLSDGAAALVLSSELKSNIRIKGMGHGTSTFYDDSLGTSFPASVKAFSRAFEEAGISPSEIQVAELHDAFTTFEVIGAEDAGIFKRGEALRQVKEGNTHPAAKWPINPSGGLKSRGHPIAASGIAQLVELSNFMQQQGKALGLTHSIGGLATNNFANILEQV